jgi:hypothetical protein
MAKTHRYKLTAIRLNTLVLGDLEAIAEFSGETVSKVIRDACKTFTDQWYGQQGLSSLVTKARNERLKKHSRRVMKSLATN